MSGMNYTTVQPKAEGRNPFTRMCYICGREFGSKSIGIHEKNCIEKWDKANAALPRDQRRPRPKPPQADAKIGGGAGAGMTAQEYNDAAFQTFMKEGREECPNCGRGFLKDRLEIHLRSCRPGGHFAKQREKRMAMHAAEDPTGTQHTGAEHLAAIPNRVKPIESLGGGGGKVQLIANRSPKPKTRPTTAAALSSPVLAKASEQPSRVVTEQLRPAAVVGVARATTPVPAEGQTLAKFCADCGYSFAAEKFCPSCGLKRGVI
ncbi:hypothetical protein HDU89_005512 [Geranomyces variabilis]|nr:hypothetical protein HDU89_005512 [Geranomyces variabilis]